MLVRNFWKKSVILVIIVIILRDWVIKMAKKLSANNIEAETKEGLTLVDFWAEWCGPCRMLNPVLEELEKKYQGKIKFAKVNVDDNQELAQSYQIMSIPAVILFKDGVAKEKVVGYKPKDAWEKYLDSKLAQN